MWVSPITDPTVEEAEVEVVVHKIEIMRVETLLEEAISKGMILEEAISEVVEEADGRTEITTTSEETMEVGTIWVGQTSKIEISSMVIKRIGEELEEMKIKEDSTIELTMVLEEEMVEASGKMIADSKETKEAMIIEIPMEEDLREVVEEEILGAAKISIEAARILTEAAKILTEAAMVRTETLKMVEEEVMIEITNVIMMVGLISRGVIMTIGETM